MTVAAVLIMAAVAASAYVLQKTGKPQRTER